MTSRLNPYLNFDGDARQAMEFYRDVFGGDLELNTYGDFGGESDSHTDRIMHALLTTPRGFVLMGADLPPGEEYRPGNTVSVSLSGDNTDELRGYWKALSDGAQVTVPLEKQMWGDEFGACVDRFGVSWMVDIGEPQP